MCILLLQSLVISADVLDIGIYRDAPIQRAILTPSVGSYEVFGDGKALGTFVSNEGIRISALGNKVELRTVSKNLGTYHQVEVVRRAWGNVFRIRPTQPQGREGKYNDNLIVTANKERLMLINRVYIEHYVGGVVEAESGSGQTSEYYKLQSIVCRTYALNNLRRHDAEGFHLCDQVHCQVYHGMSRFSELIPRAVNDTKGQVIVDSDINLITATFHSNCGGQTINAEDVWSIPLPYLQSVKDTFCLQGKHAHWETRIPKTRWLKYMNERHGYALTDTAFNPDHNREVFFASSQSGIHLKEIRHDWNLKSTFFRVEPEDEEVVIKGRGFGHGVGLCQEGAMRMADMGFSYSEIIHYYYQGVHLIDLSVLDFFQEY